MKQERSAGILILLLLAGFSIAAQPVLKQDWKASWIGEDIPSLPNTFQRYRHQFSIDKLPAAATAYIATDSKYWLYINGQLVVFEGQLKRGPTPNDTYFDSVNLRPYLRTGVNTVAILVWYWGKEGFCHNSSGRAGLLFQGEIDGALVLSGADWKVAQHLSFQQTPPPLPNFRLPEHNIRYDARLDNEAWIVPSFDDRNWKAASVIGAAGSAPWNSLWQRPIPLWYDSGLQPFVSLKEDKESRRWVGQLNRNSTITPYFKIEAPAGILIDIRTDNYTGGSEPNVRTEYITRDGVQEFETPAYINGHEVIYTFPQGVKVLELKYRETKYNTEHVGYFNSSDPFFDKLWVKSANTMNVNMRDAIQDPDRERAQWWGDAVIILEEIFYSCDARGRPASQKAISNLLEWQKDDGVLFSPIPAGNWDKELPAQMLASIGKYGIWKYIEQSGDTAMIRYAYPHVKRYMDLWQLKENGLVQHRAGGWDWHDWGSRIDVPLLDNAWYFMALESAAAMAQHLRLRDDEQHWRGQMLRIRNAFSKAFWKNGYFASDGFPFRADDRGNGLAVCAGLVTPEQWSAMRPVLDTTMNAGPYLEKYILEAYFIMNDAAAGLQRMKNRYAKMVDSTDITTLWEGWEIGSGTYGGGTYNHGWSGGPLSLLSGYVAGIRPEALGYASYSIRPQMGGLTAISAGALTVLGEVKVDVRRMERSTEMKLTTLPSTGRIALPKWGRSYKRIRISGDKGLRRTGEDAAYVYFQCDKAGRFTIMAKE